MKQMVNFLDPTEKVDFKSCQVAVLDSSYFGIIGPSESNDKPHIIGVVDNKLFLDYCATIFNDLKSE